MAGGSGFDNQADSASRFADSLRSVEAVSISLSASIGVLRGAMAALSSSWAYREIELTNKALFQTKMALTGSASEALKYVSAVKAMTQANVSSTRELMTLYSAMKESAAISTTFGSGMNQITARLQREFPHAVKETTAAIAQMADKMPFFKQMASEGADSFHNFYIVSRQFGVESARAFVAGVNGARTLSDENKRLLTFMNEVTAAVENQKQSLSGAFQTSSVGIRALIKDVADFTNSDAGKFIASIVAPAVTATTGIFALKGAASLARRFTGGAGGAAGGLPNVPSGPTPVFVVNAAEIGMTAGTAAGAQAVATGVPVGMTQTAAAAPTFMQRARGFGRAVFSPASLTVAGGGLVMASQIRGGYESARIGESGDVSAGSVLGAGAGGAISGAMIGSVVPGIGTAVGAAVGGAIGILGDVVAREAGKQQRLQERANEIAEMIAQHTRETAARVSREAGQAGKTASQVLSEDIDDLSKKAIDALDSAKISTKIIERDVEERESLKARMESRRGEIRQRVVSVGYDPEYVEEITSNVALTDKEMVALKKQQASLEESIAQTMKTRQGYEEQHVLNVIAVRQKTEMQVRLADLAVATQTRYSEYLKDNVTSAAQLPKLSGQLNSIVDRQVEVQDALLKQLERDLHVASGVSLERIMGAAGGKEGLKDLAKLSAAGQPGQEEVIRRLVAGGISKEAATKISIQIAQPESLADVERLFDLSLSIPRQIAQNLKTTKDAAIELVEIEQRRAELTQNIGRNLVRPPSELIEINKKNLALYQRQAEEISASMKEVEVRAGLDEEQRARMLRDLDIERLGIYSKMSDEVAYIRRGWEEIFTQQAMNLPSGSYILPTMTGMMQKGPAFQPYAPQEFDASGRLKGKGTYESIMGAATAESFQYLQGVYADAMSGVSSSSQNTAGNLDVLAGAADRIGRAFDEAAEKVRGAAAIMSTKSE